MFGYVSKSQLDMLLSMAYENGIKRGKWLATRTVCPVADCDELEDEQGSVGGYCGYHDTWRPTK